MYGSIIYFLYNTATLKIIYIMHTVHWGVKIISLNLVLGCVLNIAGGISRFRRFFGLSKHVEKVEDEVWTFSE